MDTALIAIVIGIVLGVAGSMIVKKVFGKKVSAEGTKQHQIYAFVENMKSVGELVVLALVRPCRLELVARASD